MKFDVQKFVENISLLDVKTHIKQNFSKDFCETYQVAKAIVSERDVRFR